MDVDRIDLRRAGERRLGLAVAPRGHQRVAQVVVKLGVARPFFHGPPKGLDGLVLAAPGAIGRAQVRQRLAGLWRQGDGGLMRPNRVLEPVCGLVGVSQVARKGGLGRVGVAGAAQQVDGVVEPPLAARDHAQQVQRARVTRPFLDDLTAQRLCLVGLARVQVVARGVELAGHPVGRFSGEIADGCGLQEFRSLGKRLWLKKCCPGASC